MNYIVVLIIISLLILIHELGHFVAARAVGIPIQIFSVGYGPAIWKKIIGATEYRISLVPLGGYVLPAVHDERDYFHIPVGKRIILASGGPAANLIIGLALYGLYNSLTAGVSAAGIFLEPFKQMTGLMQAIFASLSQLFTRPGAVSGIVGILHQGGKYIDGNFNQAVKLAVILNANLAVFNLLPVPALDGGKILLCIMEKISVRLRAVYMPVTVVGWILIIGLLIYATVMDAGKLLLS